MLLIFRFVISPCGIFLSYTLGRPQLGNGSSGNAGLWRHATGSAPNRFHHRTRWVYDKLWIYRRARNLDRSIRKCFRDGRQTGLSINHIHFLPAETFDLNLNHITSTQELWLWLDPCPNTFWCTRYDYVPNAQFKIF